MLKPNCCRLEAVEGVSAVMQAWHMRCIGKQVLYDMLQSCGAQQTMLPLHGGLTCWAQLLRKAASGSSQGPSNRPHRSLSSFMAKWDRMVYLQQAMT